MINKKSFIIFCICTIVFIPFNYVYSLEEKSNMIDNILLIGKDSAQKNQVSRSDTMIILTVDNLSKSLKLTSLARDMLVNIPGKGYEKLNHAYAYGGTKLLLKTINENLKINIRDYAVVDFKSFIEIVDILGGVDVAVDNKEIKHLNNVIETCYELTDKNVGNIEYINSTGKQNLNGYQTLAYARIRKMDTIYKRDERQRLILTNMAYKLSNTSITNYPSIIRSLVKYINVNISLDKIMKLALISHELASYEIDQLEFPNKNYRSEERINGNGIFIVKWEQDKNIDMLHKFIYGNL